MITNRAHKIRLYPTYRQVAVMRKACGTARYTYNWALAEVKKALDAGEKPSIPQLKKHWNKVKPKWVYEAPKDANQQPFANLTTAFNKFFKKTAKFPTFRNKGRRDSFYASNTVFRVDGRRVRLSKIGWVRMAEELRFEGKIMSGTVSCTAGQWYLSINVETTKKHERTTNGKVGVDLGIKALATMSDGTEVIGPKALRKNLKKLRRKSRQLSQKQKGSNNRRKAQRKLARLHKRIADVRKDCLHKLTTRLCRENQTVAIEDLNVAGMMKNGKLSRAIADMGFGEFRSQLEYKAKAYGTQAIILDRWFPSTKLCPECKTKNDMPLSKRTYECSCGYGPVDRDLHAARNILRAACPDVKPVEREALA